MQADKTSVVYVKGLLTFTLTILLMASCQFFKQKQEEDKIAVAKVNESFLYQEDLEGLVPDGSTEDDSIARTDNYIESWIRKQLMIDRAKSEIALNEANIERKVLDYRYSLILYEFEKLYIQSNLDTEVSEEEIQLYYEEQSDNFLLKQGIIRCLYAKLPKGSPDLARFRRNIRSYPNSNLEDVSEYTFQYAIDAFVDEEVWINFDEIANGTPLKNVKNKNQFLENTTFSATADDEFVYYIRILDYKVTNDLSPLEFVRENIESIIINKRKIELKKELEDAIYYEAETNQSFEIFDN